MDKIYELLGKLDRDAPGHYIIRRWSGIFMVWDDIQDSAHSRPRGTNVKEKRTWDFQNTKHVPFYNLLDLNLPICSFSSGAHV